MSTRSLIGVLNADGHSYRARYCHFDGYPHHQLPQLGYALHHGHDDNVDRLTAELLRKEWSVIDPAAATQAERDAQTRGTRPSHVQPLASVGFYYTDVEDDEDPLEGDLGEEPEMAYEWLYLFTGEFLRVFFHQSSGPRGGRWASFSDFPLSELATITCEAITRRLHPRH